MMAATSPLVIMALGQLLLVARGNERYRCPPGSTGSGYIYEYDNKCYQFILDEKTWLDAKNFCYSNQGSLVNTDTQQKHNFITGILTNQLATVFTNQGFWIGLHDRDREDQFMWDQGPGVADTPVGWTNWQTGEPNDLTGQDCVYMRRSYGWKWVDVACDGGFGRTYAFACEYKMLPTSTTSTTTSPTTPKTITTTPTTTIGTTTESTTTTKAPTTVVSTSPTTIPAVTSPLIKTTANITSDYTASNATARATTTAFIVIEKHEELKPEVPTIILPDDGDASGLSSSKAGQAKSAEHQASNDTGRYVGLAMGLIILVLIVMLIVLLLRNRRRKQEEILHTLSNPCYAEQSSGVADSSDEDNDLNGYAVCKIQPDGNVYVDFGDEKKAMNSLNGYGENNLDTYDQRYSAAPSQASFKHNILYDFHKSPPSKSTELRQSSGESVAGCSDPYMVPIPIYAEIPEAKDAVQSDHLNSSKYDVPVSRSCLDFTVNIYEELPERSKQEAAELNATPDPFGQYDVPRVPVRFSQPAGDNGNSTPALISKTSAAVAEEYNVPKSLLKSVQN